MPQSGLFVTLFDEQTLSLYLARGVYAFHMRPEREVSSRSRHYAALADYACARHGTHVFFFLKRHIVYGGQVIGSAEQGAFCLNGPYSPLGNTAKAELVWDESRRSRYRPTSEKGIFTRPLVDETSVCQPYLLIFEDAIGFKGRSIVSDDLYFELGEYPYPLPTNSIAGMGFCTMTPAEVTKTLRMLRERPSDQFETSTDEGIELQGKPLPFSPEHGISNLAEAKSEAELEASVLANPALLPQEMRPGSAVICRQVPISPFKPFQMDRADICYYQDDSIAEGTVPNLVMELKIGRFGKNEAQQVVRYLKWLNKRLGNESRRITLYTLAREYSHDWNETIPTEFRVQIRARNF